MAEKRSCNARAPKTVGICRDVADVEVRFELIEASSGARDRAHRLSLPACISGR